MRILLGNMATRDPFYWSAEWRRTRREFLYAHPRCAVAGCVKRPSHVDHVVPRARGGASFAWSNLQALCHGHHSGKTARADGGWGNPRRAVDVVPGCDVSGRPLDPGHPWNRRSPA